MKVNPLTIANLMRKVERMDKELQSLRKLVEYERENRWYDPNTGYHY